MKLNHDCIRAVMLKIEELHQITVDDENNASFDLLWSDTLYRELPEHTKENIFYALYNLDQAGYIKLAIQDGDDGICMCAVICMTYAGHEFLDKIRDAKAWKCVKAVGKEIGQFSLALINQAANGIATAWISQCLKENGISL